MNLKYKDVVNDIKRIFFNQDYKNDLCTIQVKKAEYWFCLF